MILVFYLISLIQVDVFVKFQSTLVVCWIPKSLHYGLGSLLTCKRSIQVQSQSGSWWWRQVWVWVDGSLLSLGELAGTCWGQIHFQAFLHVHGWTERFCWWCPESLEQKKEGKAWIIHPSIHLSIPPSIHPSTAPIYTYIHTATFSQFSRPATRLILRIQSPCLFVYTSNIKFFPIQHGGKGTSFNCSWAYAGMLISVSQFWDKNVF